LDVSGRPPSLGSQDVELHQQDGLPDAAQAGVDEAAFVAAGLEPFDERLEGLDVLVAAPPGSGACGRRRG
jgi:hypothetical protein